jgi:hypothetical protein
MLALGEVAMAGAKLDSHVYAALLSRMMALMTM